MTRRPHKIEFEINYAKTIEAILYVLSKGSAVNMYNVLKIMFEADKTHLNLHGRPVTGDSYVKMEHGTVPSNIFDMFKGDPTALAELEIEEFPFEKIGQYTLKAKRGPNLDYLSESDVEAINAGIDKYFGRKFGEVKDINHSEKCWIESEMNQRIEFELIIENEDVLKSLKESPLRLVV